MEGKTIEQCESDLEAAEQVAKAAEQAARDARKALAAAQGEMWRERLTKAQQFLAERLPATTQHADSPGALALDAEALGCGAPDRVYCDRHFVSLTGSAGPGLLTVLRALVELEEERERRRAAGEEVW